MLDYRSANYLISPSDIVGRECTWVPKPQSLPPWRPGEALALAKNIVSQNRASQSSRGSLKGNRLPPSLFNLLIYNNVSIIAVALHDAQ